MAKYHKHKFVFQNPEVPYVEVLEHNQYLQLEKVRTTLRARFKCECGLSLVGSKKKGKLEYRDAIKDQKKAG